MFGLTPDQVADPAIALGFVVLLIVFGVLIPRWTHNRMFATHERAHRQLVEFKDGVIADQRKVISDQARQIDRLIGGVGTSIAVAEAVQEAAAKDPDEVS